MAWDRVRDGTKLLGDREKCAETALWTLILLDEHTSTMAVL